MTGSGAGVEHLFETKEGTPLRDAFFFDCLRSHVRRSAGSVPVPLAASGRADHPPGQGKEPLQEAAASCAGSFRVPRAAFCTLPAEMQEVQTVIRFGPPLIKARTR